METQRDMVLTEQFEESAACDALGVNTAVESAQYREDLAGAGESGRLSTT